MDGVISQVKFDKYTPQKLQKSTEKFVRLHTSLHIVVCTVAREQAHVGAQAREA